jgi:hypothetical protein
MLRRWWLGLLLVRALGSQATTVPPSDPVYRVLDDLAAAGRIRTMIVGARPYSRREIARLLTEAGEADLAARYEQSRPFALVQVDAMALQSPSRDLPVDSTGAASAPINPFLDYREGRLYATNGSSVAVETAHEVSAGSHFGLAARPRVSSVRSQGFLLQQLTARARAGNFALDAGREYNVFGQERYAGLVGSQNARALDMLRLSSDAPWLLPWALRRIGPVKVTAYLADLGADQFFPHSKFVGYEISFLPRPRFEIGVHVVDEEGGHGAPGAPLGQRIADAIPLIDVIFKPENDYQFSNKLAGADARLRFPDARGLEIYFDGALDDFDARRVKSTFVDDGGYVFGFRVACLTECGALRLQGEWHYTGLRYYMHGQFVSGVTNHGRFIGDALGPKGRAAYLSLDGRAWSVETAYETRSGTLYTTAFGPHETHFHFVSYARRPSEHRVRVVLTGTSALSSRSSLRVETGVERVGNFAFLANAARVNAMARLAWEWRP